MDISTEFLKFAERGVNSLKGPDVLDAQNHEGITDSGDVTWNTLEGSGRTDSARRAVVTGNHSLMRARAPRIIGFLDHMGYGNLGDAAIQEAMIANIKKRLRKA